MEKNKRRSQTRNERREAKKELINMHKAIKDLKKRCNSTKGQVKIVDGRKIHKMLYSI
jgi:hypothetical protein